MSGTYRVVKLQKNRLYPTYQLHAFMSNDKTDPRDGLRLAALVTLHWLKARLGDDAPTEWSALPSPEEYLSATDDDLPSLYVNQGHVINIVSLPEKGMWTLQITEPDLGSDPGNPEQSRQAVPGRIIETNIAFRIVDKNVECGFKVVISDPVCTTPEAEVYRIAVVRQLIQHPAFGLTQGLEIPMKPLRLTNASQVKTMLYATHHADNTMPTVVFTQPVRESKAAPTTILPDFKMLQANNTILQSSISVRLQNLNSHPAEQETGKKSDTIDPPYNLDKFCHYTFSFCRTYVLEQAAGKSFSAQSGISFQPGAIILIYPTALGGGNKIFPYYASDVKRDETIRTVELTVKNFLKDRQLGFGHIIFLSGAREHLLHATDDLLQNAEAADLQFKQELSKTNEFWKSEIARKENDLEVITAQLQRQKEYTARLEDEKALLREEFAIKSDELEAEIKAQKETIQFLRRRYNQPRDYDGIAEWVEANFSDRILLHPKAIARMLTKSSQCASVELICDALDYLATDYWEQRYRKLPKEIALTRCGEKYGRPFEIKPVGSYTIAYTPKEYRIPYFKDERGRVSDSDLDYHLCVGNDPENLLRVYFLHDDEEQLIVVGSLPDHLRAVKVQ